MVRIGEDTIALCSKAINRTNIARYAYNLLWLGAGIFILFLPLGRSFREIGALLALVGLILYYCSDYPSSNLKRFGGMIWPYVLLIGLIIFKCFHTIDLEGGLDTLWSVSYRSFPFFFVGIELARGKQKLKMLAFLFAVMSCYEGLDGVYQYVTGVDLFRGEPIRKLYADSFRLTGSFARVGNVLSISLVIGMGLFYVLPRDWPRWRSWLVTALVLAPGMYLLIFTRTRSSYVGFAVALLLLWVLHRGFDWKKILLPLAVGFGLAFFGPQRVTFSQVLKDGRITDLWPFAIEVFKNWPILGSGVDTYNPAFRSLGLVPSQDSITIPHPHNIYLQFLAETGVIGFATLMLFLMVYSLWFLKRIAGGLRQGQDKEYWGLLSFFGCAYMGYMATAISAHSFFRVWWLGLSMLVLGVTLGGCVWAEREKDEVRFVRSGDS